MALSDQLHWATATPGLALLARRTARWSPNRLAFLAMSAVAVGCCISFVTLAVRPRSDDREGYQRFLLSDQGRVPDTQRRLTQELDRALPALLLSSVAAAVSIAAGVGGGAFFVPLFNVLLQFSVKGATALSQASITGGAISGVACLMCRRHPLDQSKTLIDFDLALMLTPVLLLGVSVGVLANSIFPTWLITFLLISLLLYITFLAARKTITLHRAEMRAAIAHQATLKGQPAVDILPDIDEDSDTQHLLADITVHSAEPAEQPSMQQGIAAKHGMQHARSDTLSGMHAVLLRHSMDSMRSSGSQLACSGDRRSTDDAWSVELSSTPRQKQGRLSQASLCEHQAADSPACEQAHASSPCMDSCEENAHDQHDDEEWANESRACSQQHDAQIAERAGGEPGDHSQGDQPACCSGSCAAPRSIHTEVDRIQENHAQAESSGQPEVLPLPWMPMLQLAGLWASFMVLQLLKSRYERCHAPYFLLFSIQAILASSTAVAFTLQAHKMQQTSSGRGWTLPQLIRASITALVGGIIAGLLGIGGGMIIGPLMLELGMHPLVSAATSSLMVLFSSSMGALAYAFDGTLNLSYAFAFGAACCAASLAGVLVVSRVVQRSGKASIVVMLLACIVGTGALLTAGFGGRNAVHDLATGHHVGFNSFC